MARGGTGLAPVAESERILTLDVVRGFALLGILLMNVEFFSRPLAELGSGMAAASTALDHGIAWFSHVFVRGKFWTLFSLLFGMGFAVMLERAQARGTPFAGPYLRRALALGAIGAAHYILLWGGDILFCYAAGAVLLLLAARWLWRPGAPVSRLRTAGLVVYLLPFVLVTAASAAMLLAPAPAGGDGQAEAEMAARVSAASAETAVMTQGRFLEAVAFRADAFVQHLGGNLGFAVIATGMFLLGAWFVRSGIMRDPAAHLPTFRRMAWIGLPLGLGLSLASAAIATSHAPVGSDPRYMLAVGVQMLGNLPACLGYLACVVLGFHGRARWLGALAPAGRMALTNYLLQSLAGTLFFYGYGLGQWGMGRGGQWLFALCLFALQVLISHWWLARFRFGPVEWLWRGATYLALPPMRR